MPISSARRTLAVQGSYKNSGQRCTAVKRHAGTASVAARFTDLVVDKTRAWTYGDPFDRVEPMGTVIDEAAAQLFEARVNDAVARGARLLAGNRATARSIRRPSSTASIPP